MKIFLLCPIPEDQKPMNEYIGLKENTLTNWTTLPIKKYKKKVRFFLFFLFIVFSLIRFPLLNNISLLESPAFLNFFFEWIFFTLWLSLNSVLLFLIILFLRWKQMEKNFKTARFFYEEASWYDGQIWEKPFLILKNDRLISTQKIEPILKRLSKTILIFFYLNFFLSFFFF